MKNFFRNPLTAVLVFLTGLGIAALSNPINLQNQYIGNDLIKEILDKFQHLNKEYPEDRIYLHLDKPFYKQGESIWFKAYLRNSINMKMSDKSDIIYVELLNPKGSIEKEIKLISKKGLANGDFILDDNAPGGIYKIKAYTNWQKNETPIPLFEKEIHVQAVVLPKLKMKLDYDRKAFGAGDEVSATAILQSLENKFLSNKPYRFIVNISGKKISESKGVTSENGIAKIKFNLPSDLTSNDGLLNIIIDHEGVSESISRSIPILLNKLTLQIFPEGGDLVAGLETKVAFKALNEFGKPADIEGYIESSKGKKIIAFSSFHNGMGDFNFKPELDETYTVKITQPKKIDQNFTLPEVLPRGYTLNIDAIKSNEISLNLSSTETEELSIIAQVRGKINHTGILKAVPGLNKYSIPTDKFPIGVTQITLFDSKGIARAERLAFVNKHKQFKVKIEADKEKYLPREKVRLTLKVTDERDIPMPADFSLAVVDDKLLSFADDRSGNILSKMYLEYDIKEKIEEPAFYFDAAQEKAPKALDYLLMTSGWRRFTWEQIQNNSLPTTSYYGEKAIVGGSVIDINTGKPISNSKLEITAKNIVVQTNDQGAFLLPFSDLSEPTTLKISSNGYRTQQIHLVEYNQNMVIGMYSTNYNHYYEDEVHMKRKAGIERAVPAMSPREGKIQNLNKDKQEEDAMAEQEVLQVVNLKRDQIKDAKKEATPIVEIMEIQEAKIMDRWAMDTIDMVGKQNQKPAIPNSKYYRARVFPAPIYNVNEATTIRTDFRSTIYWNGNVSTDRTGKAIVEFYNSDDISSFRVTAEGISSDGMIGRSEMVYFTQLPFSLSIKAPLEVTFGDVLTLPLTLKNNTGNVVNGVLKIKNPEGLQPGKSINEMQTIPAYQSKTIYLDYKVLNKLGKGNLEVSYKNSGLEDAFSQEININAKGFPASLSFSGKDMEREFSFNISNVVDGSLQASFTAYPSVVNDLMKGVESIIREPYGCFEQTSTSNYPNILVKKYIKEMEGGGKKKPEMPAGLDEKLERGYKKLISYETKEKGYEWFGGAPAHEALTAYGLMQFQDMKEVYSDLDNRMVDRTANWLMSRKDGHGGFQRSGQALDQFGRASEDVTNAYIVYGLSEAGYKDIQKEADKVYEKAMQSKDPYQLALAANIMYNLKDVSRGTKLIKALEHTQIGDGSWKGLTQSITCSQGKSLYIETTALSVMALIKSGTASGNMVNKGIEFIVTSRDSYGGFGSTQGTVLALKALTEYAKYSKKTEEDGTIEIYVDGHKIATKKYLAGEIELLSEKNLEKFLKEGQHKIKIKYIDVKNPLPYTVAINYHTFLPKSSKECKVSISTELKTSVVTIGETVRMSTLISNLTEEGLPMTMAILGIPSGLSPQPWQLKEIQEKHFIDFYEIRGNELFIYFRQMKPLEKREINLDLKADIPGNYEASASSAYLYYTNEYKSWNKPLNILIKK
jgi:hypothetical protein